MKLRAALAAATLTVAAVAALVSGLTPTGGGDACTTSADADRVAFFVSIGDAGVAAVLGFVALGFGIAQIRRPGTRAWNFGAAAAMPIALVLDTVALWYSINLCFSF